MRLLVEYKFFEPAFYTTDLPDWGTAALVCRRLGPQAQVLVDTGHHPQGTNIEQIVALLLAEGLLGGFHFNNRKYADDDLIVGSIDPFELFRIMREIALARTPGAMAFMIDQSHNIEGKIDAMIQSVDEHPDRLREGAARRRGAPRGSTARGRRARRTPRFCSMPSRPTCGRCSRGARAEMGVAPDPVEAFRAGGHAARLAEERGTASVESAYERTMTERSAFVLRISPDRIDEYVEAHRAVWPDMLAGPARRRHPQLLDLPGRQQVFGYFEVGRPRAAAAHLAGQEVSTRWQDAMAELLEERVPDAGPPALEEIFRLD